MTPRAIVQTRSSTLARLALPKSLTPEQAAVLLQQAQDAMFKLVTGQLPNSVETPQLGRVSFVAANVDDLQLMIDYLEGVVTGISRGRKPFSFEAWP